MATPSTHILIATDFSQESEAALEFGQKLLDLFGQEKVHCTLLTVLEELAQKSVQFQFALAMLDSHGIREELRAQAIEEMKDLERRFFPGKEIEKAVIRASKQVHLEIINYTNTHQVDLLVMCSKPRSGMSHVILGSTLEKVIRETKCPVIVVPTEKQE